MWPMTLFRVAAEEVVVGAEVVVVAEGLAEAAVVEVAIAVLAEAGVPSGIRAADGPAAQGHAVRVQAAALRPEGQAAALRPEARVALLDDPQTTVQYAILPRFGLLCLGVVKLVVKWSPDPEEAKALFGGDPGVVPVELFVVLEEGPQGALAVREVEQLAASGGLGEARRDVLPARVGEQLAAFVGPEVTEP